ncbi:MarR family winged helix-turn-helix transcriptional regulator [Wukongibacter baidiensis]
MRYTNVNTLRELIRILVRNLGILEKDGASCCGITIAQCHALVEIGRACKITLNDLASILTLDKSTTSRTINNLVNQGLVERETDESDRRYVKIQLTEQGNEVFVTIEKNMDQYYSNIFKSLPKDKESQVLESLNLLLDAINKNKCS